MSRTQRHFLDSISGKRSERRLTNICPTTCISSASTITVSAKVARRTVAPALPTSDQHRLITADDRQTTSPPATRSQPYPHPPHHRQLLPSSQYPPSALSNTRCRNNTHPSNPPKPHQRAFPLHQPSKDPRPPPSPLRSRRSAFRALLRGADPGSKRHQGSGKREASRKMSTAARRRLMRDFKRMQTDPPAGVSASPIQDNVMTWFVFTHPPALNLSHFGQRQSGVRIG